MIQTTSPTTLYRLFSADGRLLYVGVAGNPGRRFEQHRKEKPWWGDVAEIKLEHFPDRPEAMAAELRAIQGEDPQHNIAGKLGAVQQRRPAATGCRGWSFSTHKHGYCRTGVALELGWEANGSCVSYDEGIEDPAEAFEYWVDYIHRADARDMSASKFISPKGWVNLSWYVKSEDDHGIFELASHQQYPTAWTEGDAAGFFEEHHFLNYFTWPRDDDGRFLNFLRLPIAPVKSWFITEATGYVPGPLQPAIHLPTLVEMFRREAW